MLIMSLFFLFVFQEHIMNNWFKASTLLNDEILAEYTSVALLWEVNKHAWLIHNNGEYIEVVLLNIRDQNQCLFLPPNASYVDIYSGVLIHTFILTRLLSRALAGRFAGLAPHRHTVLQKLQAPVLPPTLRSNLHHLRSLKHHTHVLIVQHALETHTHKHTQH